MNLVTSSHSGLFAEPPLSPTPIASAVEPPAAPVPAPTAAPAALAPSPLAPAPVAPPAPVQAAAERPVDLPLEAQLVRMGLLTLEQLAEANRTRLESGGTVADIVVANGWVTREQIAVLTGETPTGEPATPAADEPGPAAEERAPVAEAPAPALAPAPTLAPPPTLAPAPSPAPEAAPLLRVADPEPEPMPEPLPEPEVVAVAPPVPVAPTAPIESHPVKIGAPAPPTFTVALRLHGGERVDVLSGVEEAEAKARAKEIVSELSSLGADEWPSYAGRFLRPEAIVSVDVFQD